MPASAVDLLKARVRGIADAVRVLEVSGALIHGPLAAGDLIRRNAANAVWERLAVGAGGDFLQVVGGMPTWAAGGGGSAHNILSATHLDAVIASLVAGDVLYVDATPKLNRLAVGANGDVLTVGSGMPAWSAPIGSTHTILDPTHTDTVPGLPPIRGSLIYGNATPKWDRLVLGATKRRLLSNGIDTFWGGIDDQELLRLANDPVPTGTTKGSIWFNTVTGRIVYVVTEGPPTTLASIPILHSDLGSIGADDHHGHTTAGEKNVAFSEEDEHTSSVVAAGITANSKVFVTIAAKNSADRLADENWAEELTAYVANVQAGVGFDIVVKSPNGPTNGTVPVYWVYLGGGAPS